MKRINNSWLLGIICLVGLFLRLWQVASIPPSLSWDEVSIGYNAYSILTTGADEHGRLFPLDTFVAYGDYKPPLAIYLTVPFVAVFGLNDLGVRMPVVVVSVITIIGIYFLAEELFKRQKTLLSLLISGLFAISPWHVQLSRAGFEATIALGFLVWGVWAVLVAMRKPIWRIWCWLPFVAAIYTFNSSRYLVPFLGLGLVVFGYKQWINFRKYTVIGLVIVGFALLPILPHLLSSQARLRFAEVNIFTDASIVNNANRRIAFSGNTWWGNILNNRRIGFARAYLLHFFDNFEPQFLFISGDGNPKFSLQDLGQLYLIEAPFLVIGFLWLLRRERPMALLLIFWLVAAIMPAAVARETPHALRTLNGLPVWYVWIGYGIWVVITSLPNNRRLVVGVALGILYGLSFTYFAHHYFIHYPVEYSGEWQYGYREAVRYAEIVKDRYSHIVMTDSIGRPYMYTAFYGHYSPNVLLQSKKRYFDAAGFYHLDGFGKYDFVRGSVGKFASDSLYILDPEHVPKNAHVLNTIYRLNGTTALVIFDML